MFSLIGKLFKLALLGIAGLVLLGLLARSNLTPEQRAKIDRDLDQAAQQRAQQARETPAQKSLRPGGHARLVVPGQSTVWVCVDSQSHDDMIRAANRKDEAGIMQMMLQGRVLVCHSNTRVLVLDPGWLTHTVRVLEGKHAGSQVIVTAEHAVAE